VLPDDSGWDIAGIWADVLVLGVAQALEAAVSDG
jgi:hypothetical protein